MQVIPAINCHVGYGDCVEDFLRKANFLFKKGFFSKPLITDEAWMHLDIADGKFTYNKTWGNPNELARLVSSYPRFKWEVHLMVEEPEAQVKDWILAGAARLIIHVETINIESAQRILDEANKKGIEVTLASNPETPAEDLSQHLKNFSNYLILAVNPGFSGQKFLSTVLEKIKFLRKNLPNAKIEVDGGINKETGKIAKDAGADILIASSYIWSSKNPKSAYKELSKI